MLGCSGSDGLTVRATCGRVFLATVSEAGAYIVGTQVTVRRRMVGSLGDGNALAAVRSDREVGALGRARLGHTA